MDYEYAIGQHTIYHLDVRPKIIGLACSSEISMNFVATIQWLQTQMWKQWVGHITYDKISNQMLHE